MGAAAAGAGFQVAGGTLSAVGDIQQGRAQATAQQYNAGIALRDASTAKEQAVQDAATQQRQATQILGAGRAAYGASGITTDGSAMDVLQAGTASAELDRLNILYKGDLKALGYQDMAKLDEYGAKVATQQSKLKAASSIISSVGGAGSSMM